MMTHTDVVRYMENKYPEMTQEFRTIQQEQYELFLHKQHDYGPQNVAVGSLLKTKKILNYHYWDYGSEYKTRQKELKHY